MRIFLSAIVVILGVNLLIDLMDSNLVDVMKERNETIQRQIDQMWRSDRCPLFWHGGPFPCILEEWRGFHFTNVLHFSLMRKIEQQMCRAIQSNINWQSANTAVTFDEESNVSTVFLHGNKIAEVGDTFIRLFDGGWQSNTTKSRLNAILSEHGIAGEGVFQHKFEWFIRLWNGEEFVTTEFRSGMRLAWGVNPLSHYLTTN